MTDHQRISEIITLFTFLSQHVQNYVDQSFNDLSFDIEKLILEYLNVFEDDTSSYYSNSNKIKHNFPAIDLVNDKKGVAIQVTTNADARKAKKTLEKYKQHGLDYSSLIIIGFVKNTNPKLNDAEIHGVNYLVNLAKHSTSKQLDKAFDVLKRKVPWTSLNPLDDKHCFDVVFDVLNRSAIRDLTYCEGNFDNMLVGLDEAKQIITTGFVKNKSIRAKALVEYTDTVKRKLSEIEFYISQIVQICNTSKNRNPSNLITLLKTEVDEIDDLKKKIIESANKLALDLGINRQILVS